MHYIHTRFTLLSGARAKSRVSLTGQYAQVCMLPRWCAAARVKALEPLVKAVSFFCEAAPLLLSSAGCVAAMLLVIRAHVSRNVVFLVHVQLPVRCKW